MDLQNEFNKNLLQKNEENSRLKNLNQGLTKQIKKLKNEELKKSPELLSTSKSRESQTIEVSTRISQMARIPYRHPNHRSRYNQHQHKEENKHSSSYRQTNYNLENKQKQHRQLLWKPKLRSFVRAVDHQTIPMKVDLGWITSQKMQHISSEIRRLYRLVSSSIVVPSSQHHEKSLRAREQSHTINYALRTKQL